MAGVLAIGAAHAAEPVPPAPPPPGPTVSADTFEERWHGAYAIGLVGKGWANMFTPQSSGLGWTAGLAVGFNRQQGRFVTGVEADGMWSGREGTFYDIPWTSSFRLRWGIAGERFLLYGAGGAAATHVNNTATAPFSSTEFGWTIGGGLDIGLGNRFIGRVEYLYSRYGDLNGTNFPVATHEVRMGAGARF
ncbi:MAG: porin family protein [Bauldia sp.]|nr:porin family protein [Bauldia sp.]